MTFEAKPLSDIAMDVDGAAGLAGGDKKKEDDKDKKDGTDATKKPDEPKKHGFGIPGISASKQNQSNQQVASAGARGGLPDRDAKGGPTKTALGVKVSTADLEAFKKGIVA